MAVKIKRVYDSAAKADGHRVLVDRVWPRGIKKADANVDEWLKDVGPSTDLRKWFGHDPERFDEFATRYKAELKGSDQFDALRQLAKDHTSLTLVYSAKDEQHNQAVVLKQLLS